MRAWNSGESDPLADMREAREYMTGREGYKPDNVVVPMETAREWREDMQKRGIDNFDEYMAAIFNELSEEEKARVIWAIWG